MRIFFYLCFVFEIFHFNRILPCFFSCVKTLLNIIHDGKETSKFSPMVLWSFIIPTRVHLLDLEKIGYRIWSLSKFRLGKFLTDFLRKTVQLVNVMRAKINYVFIDLVSVKFLFWKMKSFLVKDFYMNFVKKVKCIFNLVVLNEYALK